MKRMLKKLFLIAVLITALIISILFISETGDYYVAKGEPSDIEKIISDGITDEDYIILKEQTGLSKSAVCDILNNENALEELEEFQKQNFSEYNVECRYMFFPITKAERLTDENGKSVKLKFPTLKTGDILITKSTHTLLFRHGHAGLVTSAENAEVLEAMMLGVNSDYGNIASWKHFPAVAVLRPKNLSEEKIEKIVSYAKDNLYDVKYSLFAGVLGKTTGENGEVLKTHCSHLVWHAYKNEGINIDSNGGVFVLPDDFLKSEELEVIWSYGINALK